MSYLDFKDPRPIKEMGEYDVLVVGGGVAGVSAALSASRLGASVILLEKSLILGGLATAGNISWYEPLCDGNGLKMVGGIGEELIKAAVKYGPEDLPSIWKEERDKTEYDPRYACFFSPTIFSLVLNNLLEKENVHVLMDISASYPIMDGNNCNAVVAEAREGKIVIFAKTVIDATGDASICHSAGIPTVGGKNRFTYMAHILSLNKMKKINNKNEMIRAREWKWFGYTLDQGENRERDLEGITTEDVTEYNRKGQSILFDALKNEEKGSLDIISLPSLAQFRTIRHIVGEYDFTGEENRYDDSIGCTGDFRKRGPRFQIPYRILYSSRFPNILAAGRIVSASSDGWEITRVIPVAALTGEASGAAAYMAVKNRCSVGEINIKELQEILKNKGVIIDWI